MRWAQSPVRSRPWAPRAVPLRLGNPAATPRRPPPGPSRTPVERRWSWSGPLPTDRSTLGRLVDRGADPFVGAAAADVARHRGVDVGVGGVGVAREQRGGGHDLARLAVAALRHVERDPRLLHLLAGGGVADRLDGRDCLAGDGAHRRPPKTESLASCLAPATAPER